MAVCLIDCYQDAANTTGCIFMRKISLGSTQIPFNSILRLITIWISLCTYYNIPQRSILFECFFLISDSDWLEGFIYCHFLCFFLLQI